MRQPTKDPFAWHTEALADAKLGDALHRRNRVPIPADPQCGWYRRRLIKGGPWVPARIWIEAPVDEAGELTGDEVMKCVVNGQMADPVDQWGWLADQPISRADYDYLVRLARYAATDEREPLSDPRKAVDINKTKPPSFRKD